MDIADEGAFFCAGLNRYAIHYTINVLAGQLLLFWFYLPGTPDLSANRRKIRTEPESHRARKKVAIYSWERKWCIEWPKVIHTEISWQNFPVEHFFLLKQLSFFYAPSGVQGHAAPARRGF